MKYSILDIDDYRERLSEKQKEKVVKHCNKYDIKPTICAWYDDRDDFYSDWVDGVGYTKAEARNLLKDNKNEFLIFPTGEIVRFAI